MRIDEPGRNRLRRRGGAINTIYFTMLELPKNAFTFVMNAVNSIDQALFFRLIRGALFLIATSLVVRFALAR